MKLLKEGSRWGAGDRKVFVVISEVTTDDGHEWVYYRDEAGNPPREYSCYKESFLSRNQRRWR